MSVIESTLCDSDVIDRYFRERHDAVDALVFSSMRAIDAFERWFVSLDAQRAAAIVARLHVFALGSNQCDAVERLGTTTSSSSSSSSSSRVSAARVFGGSASITDATTLCVEIERALRECASLAAISSPCVAFLCSTRHLPTIPQFFAQQQPQCRFTALPVYAIVERSDADNSNSGSSGGSSSEMSKNVTTHNSGNSSSSSSSGDKQSDDRLSSRVDIESSICIERHVATLSVGVDVDQRQQLQTDNLSLSSSSSSSSSMTWLVFFSPSGVTSFARLASNRQFVQRATTRIACIGPTTANAVRQTLALEPHAVAASPNPTSLLESIRKVSDAPQ